MRGMNAKLLSLLLLGCCLTAPLAAQEDAADAPATPAAKAEKPKSAKQLAADVKKAQDAVKKQEKIKKDREKVKIKWVSSDKKAFKEAAKYNLPVWVLYSDPATCKYCVMLDEEIIFSKEFKKAKGLFIGYRSTSPLPQYQCDGGKPMGALFSPDKKKLCTLAYSRGQGAETYIDTIKGQADKIQEAAEKKAKADLEAAEAALEAAKEEAPAEEE